MILFQSVDQEKMEKREDERGAGVTRKNKKKKD